MRFRPLLIVSLENLEPSAYRCMDGAHRQRPEAYRHAAAASSARMAWPRPRAPRRRPCSTPATDRRVLAQLFVRETD